jgi:hypothetical protein
VIFASDDFYSRPVVTNFEGDGRLATTTTKVCP